MEQRECKGKNCTRILPKGYKYKYCEQCRGKQVGIVKKIFAVVVGVFSIILFPLIVKIVKGLLGMRDK